MFDFKKEVNRFRPMTEVDDLESIMNDNEVQDIMDLIKLASAVDEVAAADSKKKE